MGNKIGYVNNFNMFLADEYKVSTSKNISEYDSVYLLRDVGDIPKGKNGVVVLKYDDNEHVEVEFEFDNKDNDVITLPLNTLSIYSNKETISC